jgi:hypothetical protein
MKWIILLIRSQGGAVSVVSDYWLGDRGSIPSRGKVFFLQLLCPDQLWAHPVSYPVSTGSPFPGGKAQPEGGAYHSP